MKCRSKFCVRAWIKYAIPYILLALSFLYGFWLRGVAAGREIAEWRTILMTPEPDICALCGYGSGPRYHAPCLVNLSTGEVGEMRIYDPDPERICEVSRVQRTGTFSLLRVAGVPATRDTVAHTCTADLPRKTDGLAPEYFCRDCRARIAEVSCQGFILADLYDLADIRIYALSDETACSIRDYDVSVCPERREGFLSVEITGRLYG